MLLYSALRVMGFVLQCRLSDFNVHHIMYAICIPNNVHHIMYIICIPNWLLKLPCKMYKFTAPTEWNKLFQGYTCAIVYACSFRKAIKSYIFPRLHHSDLSQKGLTFSHLLWSKEPRRFNLSAFKMMFARNIAITIYRCWPLKLFY